MRAHSSSRNCAIHRRKGKGEDDAKPQLKGTTRWGTEREIKLAAMQLFSKFALPNRLADGCYLLTFFLRQYLRLERGIDARAVVGFIREGREPLMQPHAWLDFGGKKTDLSLVLKPVPGDLIVLDEIWVRGEVSCTYHREQSSEAKARAEEVRQGSREGAAEIGRKELEHREMLVLAASDEEIWAFSVTHRNATAMRRSSRPWHERSSLA